MELLIHTKHSFATCLQNTKLFHIESFPHGWIIGTAADALQEAEDTPTPGRRKEEEKLMTKEERKEQEKAWRSAGRQKQAQRLLEDSQSVAIVLSHSAHSAWQAAGAERHIDLGPRVMAVRLALLDSITEAPHGVFLVSAQEQLESAHAGMGRILYCAHHAHLSQARG